MEGCAGTCLTAVEHGTFSSRVVRVNLAASKAANWKRPMVGRVQPVEKFFFGEYVVQCGRAKGIVKW